MPYIMVEEVPEGMEAVDLVPRADYDAAITERDSYAQQRDDALSRIEQAEQDAREAKARYADYILSGAGSKQVQQQEKKVEHGPLSARELFARK